MSATSRVGTAEDGESTVTDVDRILEESGADPADAQLVDELQAILDGTYEPHEPARAPLPNSSWWLRVPLVVLSFFVWTPLWAFSQSAWTAVGLPVWLAAAAWVLYFQGRGWPHRWLLSG
jgi:hypothetical protein